MERRYLIFSCPRCGAVRYAKQGQRTAECFTCGLKISIQDSRTKVLLRTDRLDEAIEAVKKYKMRLHSSR
ncbi:MAG: DUF1922 domain-containing protein [Candidatus Bathyarchaeota archaeon]|nr:DUF1922 domain-containing protein [Candidatus Bathyarchaeota archaeon]